MIKIILPAHMIPLGTTVRKPTGTKQYRLVQDLFLFDEQGNRVSLVSGSFLLVSGSNILMVSAETPLAVYFDELKDAKEFLSDLVAVAEE